MKVPPYHLIPPSMEHLTYAERMTIQNVVGSGAPQARAAEALGRPPSVVSDELRRNRLPGKPYDAGVAQALADARACRETRRGKLDAHPGVKKYVVDKLTREQWSPEEIAERLRKDAGGRRVVSHETIYQFVYSKEGRDLGLWKHLRHKKKPHRTYRGTGRKRKHKIPERIPIALRPDCVGNRERFGDWEGDLVQFSSTGQVLAVFAERKSGKPVIVLNWDKSAPAMEAAMHELVASVGQANVLSLTLDNGSENVCHARVRDAYCGGFGTYFCDAYKSWQKGCVENLNKLIRQYFPRDIDPERLTSAYVQEVVEKLSSRPRARLGYATPDEVWESRP